MTTKKIQVAFRDYDHLVAVRMGMPRQPTRVQVPTSGQLIVRNEYGD